MSKSDATPEKRANQPDRNKTTQSSRAGSQAVMTDYSPEFYAFRFPNAFVNQIWSGRIPPFIGRKFSLSTAGRCGGMAFASLDFFHHNTPVPSLTSRDFSPSKVPPDGHPLADYIYARQLHSMLTTVGGARDGLRYLQWSGQPAKTVLSQTLLEEHKIMESLDRGRPVVLGLIKATSRSLKAQGQNHQAVCYGYQLNAARHPEFYIYDPNEPFRDSSNDPYAVILGRVENFQDAEFPYRAIRSDRVDRWRGFFVVGYRPHRPTPDVLSV